MIKTFETGREGIMPDMQDACFQNQKGPRLPPVELLANIADLCGIDAIAVDVYKDGPAHSARLDQECIGADCPANQQQIVDVDRKRAGNRKQGTAVPRCCPFRCL